MSYIAIIDYEMGNIKSIFNAFEKVGAEVVLTRDKAKILGAVGVVLPGVGAFSHGMKTLTELGLDKIIHEYVATGKPLIGICLGMQMLFETSNEFGVSSGLSIIPGRVEKLKTLDINYEKLPHVSWSEILEKTPGFWKSSILDGISANEDMYFVHSFAVEPKDPNNILSSTIYSGAEFCSSVKHQNIYGCQFHPEKSATSGLKVISNFVNICRVNND
ncbi:imidazole glycerol phosphate synthase subunit HisH [Aestuariirhabdus sp. Z084]|uniref:imidazole glycerol phosphate synthase subunit HisH n=1 Tax=Aestuariirhabdus haliotis TaxID=2918751 RepID=UPI00201B3E0C|nr:imidazole glycerol phosphate synthase subunit HisH [Aestuariirhabdus haliotis]MCL6415599.1 imidazole glycerol phosphate synthase subunit HisH [Aestuariirhabdus haliotis]MCL6419594.1 imidazole glycerol phosphate synthase subunit HisH [Aestuariirhabdus haliotis]